MHNVENIHRDKRGTAEHNLNTTKSPKLRELESICPGLERDKVVQALFEQPTTGRVRVLNARTEAQIGHSILVGGQLDYLINVLEITERDTHSFSDPAYEVTSIVEDL